MSTQTIILSDADATEVHGRETALRLSSGGIVLALEGDLGAGKTTWVRGLARGLGLDRPVRSPTYTYRVDYELPDGRRLVHADLYRLAEGADLTGFELDELASDASTILAIEWAERLPFDLPPTAWRLRFDLAPDGGRILTLTTP